MFFLERKSPDFLFCQLQLLHFLPKNALYLFPAKVSKFISFCKTCEKENKWENSLIQLSVLRRCNKIWKILFKWISYCNSLKYEILKILVKGKTKRTWKKVSYYRPLGIHSSTIARPPLNFNEYIFRCQRRVKVVQVNGLKD